MQEMHARRPNPYLTWCGLDATRTLATCWAHQVTCDECRERIVEAVPARSMFFIDPLWASSLHDAGVDGGTAVYQLRTTREV